MTGRFPYLRTHFPPIPTIQIVLVAPEVQRSTRELVGLIDTGADATFSPLRLLEEIRAPLSRLRRARSIWGDWRHLRAFIVDVRLGKLTYPGIEVLGYAGDEIILGRDVLNKLQLLLDGPAETTEILEKRTRRERR